MPTPLGASTPSAAPSANRVNRRLRTAAHCPRPSCPVYQLTLNILAAPCHISPVTRRFLTALISLLRTIQLSRTIQATTRATTALPTARHVRHTALLRASASSPSVQTTCVLCGAQLVPPLFIRADCPVPYVTLSWTASTPSLAPSRPAIDAHPHPDPRLVPCSSTQSRSTHTHTRNASSRRILSYCPTAPWFFQDWHLASRPFPCLIATLVTLPAAFPPLSRPALPLPVVIALAYDPTSALTLCF